MKNIILKAALFIFFSQSAYALHGKIVFYDGTYVVGKVTKVDEASVYIVPIGLDTPEGVLVGNIDSLKMENGMVPVINSAVKYFYQGGEFLANDNDWMDEYDDFQYDDYATLQEEYKYEETKKIHTNYWSASAFGAYPAIKFSSLDDSTKLTKMSINMGFGLQSPYFPFGAVDISPGIKLMTYGFTDHPEMGTINAMQAKVNLSTDLKPILFFLPEALHLCVDFGLSYNVGLKVEPKSSQYEGDPKYGGMGLSAGMTFDYHFTSIPIAFRLFAENTIIPQGIPFPELKTGFLNIGANIIIILKRHRKE